MASAASHDSISHSLVMAAFGVSIGFFAAIHDAQAGQPMGKVAGEWLRAGAETQTPPHAPIDRLEANARRLDLAAPAALATPDSAELVFPSNNRRLMESYNNPAREQPTGRRESMETASLQSDVSLSRAQALAQNYRREGLPVAKLWQTKDALVHVGLNNKGKPGLWIVEKLH